MLISHMLKSENRAHGLKKVFRSIGFPKFSENYIPSSAEEAQILAEKHQAELAMYFHAWPDELHFDFDPQNVDVNEIWSVIEQVCKKHNLIVMRPPSDRINF